MKGGYVIGKASRASIQRRHEAKSQRDSAFLHRMLASDKPFCLKCDNCYGLRIKKDGWGAANKTVCAKGRKKHPMGGKCRFFVKGWMHNLTIEPVIQGDFNQTIDNTVKEFLKQLFF